MRPNRIGTPLIAALALVVAGLAAGCQSAPAGPMPTPPAGAVVVTAHETRFMESAVTAPAEQPFMLFFENRDGAPHNVHVVDAAGKTVVQGDIFNGPGAQTDEVPALPPGTYSLICDVHPGMHTELVVQ